MAVKEQLNLEVLRERFIAAFQTSAHAYEQQLQTVFYSPRQWPPGFGTTYRKNGEVVTGSYRNIYDLGNAARSQQASIGQTSATYSWDGQGKTPMVVVHEGATLRNGNRIPARRFTLVAAFEAQLPQVFAAAFRGEA